MTNEEKNLLLQDLCARLPYGVNVDIKYSSENGSSLRAEVCSEGMLKLNTDVLGLFQEEEIYLKPYLRPMSSMMQGEWEEMTGLIYPYGKVNRDSDNDELLLWLSAEENDMPIILMDNVFSWLNKKMFDYRGLIPMGLALPAKKGMYKTKSK